MFQDYYTCTTFVDRKLIVLKSLCNHIIFLFTFLSIDLRSYRVLFRSKLRTDGQLGGHCLILLSFHALCANNCIKWKRVQYFFNNFKRCHNWGGQSPFFHRGSPGLRVRQSVWDLWWIEWRSDGAPFGSFGFFPSVSLRHCSALTLLVVWGMDGGPR
jgi:hypothetical protein